MAAASDVGLRSWRRSGRGKPAREVVSLDEPSYHYSGYFSVRVIGVIPARFRSTRLVGKPLVEILGKPMMQHVYENARRARSLDEVIIATDDERIRTAAEAFGAKAVMTSSEHSSGTDRVAETIGRMEVDIVVNVQGDEPLLPPEMIEECVGLMLRDPSVEIGTLMKRVENEDDFDNPAVVKVVTDLRGRALYFSRSLLPYPSKRTPQFKVCEHLGIYAYRKQTLLQFSKLPPTPLEEIEGLEQLRALEHGILIHVVETSCRCELVSVDTVEDLARVRGILAAAQAMTG